MILGNKTLNMCGMSVYPYMMQRIASELHKQWLGTGDENTGV
jgi:hypothetical protein